MLAIPPYICSHLTSGGLSERVRLAKLGLQPVEPRPWTPTHDISMRTGYLVSPTRNWDSFLVNIGWGIWLAGLLGMKDRIFLLVAI